MGQSSSTSSYWDCCHCKGHWLLNCHCGWHPWSQWKCFFVNYFRKHKTLWVWGMVWCSFSGMLILDVPFYYWTNIFVLDLNLLYASYRVFFMNQGSKDDPAQQEIELTTAPSLENITHWGQQVFVIEFYAFQYDIITVGFFMRSIFFFIPSYYHLLNRFSSCTLQFVSLKGTTWIFLSQWIAPRRIID